MWIGLVEMYSGTPRLVGWYDKREDIEALKRDARD